MNAKVMVLGTFHFCYDESMKMEKSKAQVMDVVDKLTVFKPTKIAVEQRAHRQKILDESFRRFSVTGIVDTNKPGHLNEVVMLGFQTALKCGITKIHAIDYMRLFFYDWPVKYAKWKYPTLAEEILNMKKEFSEHDSQIENESLMEKLKYMNSPEYISMLHNADYLNLNRVGALKNYFGTRILTSWYRRNLGIFANLQAICEDDDHVLVIIGAGHLSTINTFVQEYHKMDFVSPLEYLK